MNITSCSFGFNSGKSTASSLSINSDSVTSIANTNFVGDIILPSINIAGSSGLVKMRNCTHQNCVGAIQTIGSLEIFNSSFISNTGNPFTGIYYKGGYLSVDQCMFADSYGTSYGCILCDSLSPHGVVTIQNSTFENNFTLNVATSIYVSGVSTATISNCTFSNNNSSRLGGAIAVEQNSNTTIENCLFVSNAAQYGGSISLQGHSYLTIIDSTATFVLLSLELS